MSTQFELIEPTEIDVNNKVNIGLDQLEIYPNPASNEVNVEMNSTDYSYILYTQVRTN